MATCKISELAKLSKLAIAAKNMKDRKPASKPKPVIQTNEDGEVQEKEPKADDEEDQIPSEIVGRDFIARK